jgi:hypothetical protein
MRKNLKMRLFYVLLFSINLQIIGVKCVVLVLISEQQHRAHFSCLDLKNFFGKSIVVSLVVFF